MIAHRVSRSGKDLDLTHREYELLVYLVRDQRETVSRARVCSDVEGLAFSWR